MRARGSSELRLSTSRTETARYRLPRPTPIHISATPANSLFDAYVGAPTLPPVNPAFPGATMNLPFAAEAIQFFIAFTQPDPIVLLSLDLGANYDLARIELFGNPLLPPLSQNEKPAANFGLPSRIHVLVSEESFTASDLHNRDERGTFYSNPFIDWREVWSSDDFRALWGWNALHLNAAFGRYVTFLFAGLPQMLLPPGAPGFGIDIQRIVFYPYLEDADHRPHVEHSVVSARVGEYAAPSDYWTALNEAAPAPATHQGVFFDQQRSALPLPCVLSGLQPISPAGEPAAVFVSHPVPADPGQDNRIYLITEATTDHEPLLEGVHLVFRGPEEKGTYLGPKWPFFPNYLIRVHVTNDREAAYSSDRTHPSWRLAAAEESVAAERLNDVCIFFAEPIVARWVRLTVRPVAPDGADPSTRVGLQLHRLDLIRSQSWRVTPAEDEDIDIETVFIRLRGPRILDDYAYIEGSHGFGIFIDAQLEDGSIDTIRSFRNLLEVIEETHHRIFQNHRRADKPVQRYHEISDSDSISRSRLRQRSTGSQTARVQPGFNNTQVVRSGSITDYVLNPHDNLGDAAFDGLPDVSTAGVTTTRTYDIDLDGIDAPQLDLLSTDPGALFAAIVQWAGQVAAQGLPISLGIGGNFGVSGGIAAGGTASASGGVSVNAGTQVGGGVTKSKTRGNQGSVVRTENRTISAQQTQSLTGRNVMRSRQTAHAHDDRLVVRTDNSPEIRKNGLEIRYGGNYEDLVLITVPVSRRLRGGFRTRASAQLYMQGAPPVSREALRVRVDYLPPGVRMDVQFRGRAIPHPEAR
jgi:hypothetical protein